MAFDPRAQQFQQSMNQFQRNMYGIPERVPMAQPMISPNTNPGYMNFDATGAVSNVAANMAGGAAAGGSMGGWPGALIGLLKSGIEHGVPAYQAYRASQAMPTTEEQARANAMQAERMRRGMMPEQRQVYNMPTRDPLQQGYQMAMLPRLLADLYKPGQSFDPIANEARRQFQEETIPRILAAGGGTGFGSEFEKNMRKGATDLESNLAAQSAQFYQQQDMQRQRILPQLAQLGMSPSFENVYGPPGMFPNAPQTLQNQAINAARAKLGLPPIGEVPRPEGPRAIPQPGSRKFRESLSKYPNLLNMMPRLNRAQKERLGDLMFRTGDAGVRFLDKIRDPESIERLHQMAFAEDPKLAKAARNITSEKYIDDLYGYYLSGNVKKIDELARRVDSATSRNERKQRVSSRRKGRR